MDKFKDLLPRSKEVAVGKHILVVEEMVIEQWEEFVEQLAPAIDLGKLARTILTAFGNVEPGDESKNEVKFVATDLMSMMADRSDDVGEIAEGLIGKVLAKNVPMLAVFGLQNAENFKRLKKDEAPLPESTVPEQAVESYVRKVLTVRQQMVVLEAVLKVNDFRDSLGKFWGLLATALETVPEEMDEDSSPPDSSTH